MVSFFDPDLDDRSLGVFSILQEIELCVDMGLEYLYLGYWINGSKKMRYKTRFGPQERLGTNGWEEELQF